MKLVVATHNEGKLVEIRRILEEDLGADAAQVELVSAGSLGLPDPVETGVTFQENALLKARFVAGLTGLRRRLRPDCGRDGQRAWHPVRALGGGAWQ